MSIRFWLSNNNKWRWWVQTLAAYRQTRSPSRLAWSEGLRPLGAVLHSSNEPGELPATVLQFTLHYYLSLI